MWNVECTYGFMSFLFHLNVLDDHTLCACRTPICSTLVNLAASFLPNANASSVKTLPVLLKLPKLRRLEFRKKTAEVGRLPTQLTVETIISHTSCYIFNILG